MTETINFTFLVLILIFFWRPAFADTQWVIYEWNEDGRPTTWARLGVIFWRVFVLSCDTLLIYLI